MCLQLRLARFPRRSPAPRKPVSIVIGILATAVSIVMSDGCVTTALPPAGATTPAVAAITPSTASCTRSPASKHAPTRSCGGATSCLAGLSTSDTLTSRPAFCSNAAAAAASCFTELDAAIESGAGSER